MYPQQFYAVHCVLAFPKWSHEAELEAELGIIPMGGSLAENALPCFVLRQDSCPY